MFFKPFSFFCLGLVEKQFTINQGQVSKEVDMIEHGIQIIENKGGDGSTSEDGEEVASKLFEMVFPHSSVRLVIFLAKAS